MKAQVNLKENNFSIIFDQRPPDKIIFQLKYFNLDKEESEEKIEYSSAIHLINMEKIVNFLEKNKINPIVSKFRDKQFWDNGIHCVTQDLYREGEMEDYFHD